MTRCNVGLGTGVVTCGKCEDEPEWVEVERQVDRPVVVMECPNCVRRGEFDGLRLGVPA